MAAVSSPASEFAILTATSGDGGLSATLLAVMVANVGPTTMAAKTSRFNVVTAYDGLPLPETSELAVMVAYSTGQREDNSQRAWTFPLDGHTFYVIDLGVTGTYVYDLTTNQWAQWRTEGYTIWNAQRGTLWGNKVVAGDFQTPGIYEIDPRESLDEGFRTVRRAVTGLLTTRSRDYISVDALSVIASVGDAQTNFAGTAEMTLSFSDDQGQTYYTFGSETLSDTDTDQELLFRSLGAFNMPGRVFRIEDLGGPVRIDSAVVTLTPEA